MSERTLLVIEDDPGLASQMGWCIDNANVSIANDRDSAIDALRREPPQVITLDLGLPPDPGGYSIGLKLLEDIQRLLPSAKVIVITGREDHDAALQSLAHGASDFYTKPIDAETLNFVVNRAFRIYALEQENRRLAKAALRHSSSDFIGQSESMTQLKAQIERVASADISVLITGETGTGKELVARALHAHSPRSENPLVAINCAAIPENLLESELFGHEKGAFTGANSRKLGKIEAANGGTLFLDEIGDMPFSLQAKLLRFTEDRVIERLGSNTRIPVDVRIVAATHQDIGKQIDAGKFRQDLYFRLGEVTLHIPPLHARAGDALLIANALLKKYGNGEMLKLTESAADAIEAWHWPGNVRELENRIKRACLLADSRLLNATDLELIDVATRPHDLTSGTALPSSAQSPPGTGPVPLKATQKQPLNLQEVRRLAEQDAILRALARTEGNVSKAAKLLGITRPTLYNLFEKYEIQPRPPETASRNTRGTRTGNRSGSRTSTR